MQNKLNFIACCLMVCLVGMACQSKEVKVDTTRSITSSSSTTSEAIVYDDSGNIKPMVKTEEEWRAQLTAEQFRILRLKGTERAFIGEYWDHKEEGTYHCAACQLPLFESETKFKSDTGWPSFYQPIQRNHIKEHQDNSYGMAGTEVICGRCKGHLGHIFTDRPEPTGLRYCINSASLDFVAD